jgi:hypothetical protein
MHLYSGNAWIILIPLDYDISMGDGIQIVKGKKKTKYNYNPNTMIIFGGDISHHSLERKKGLIFAQSIYNEAKTQRRIFQLVIAPNIALYQYELQITSFASQNYSDVIFVIDKSLKLTTFNKK